MHKYFIEIFKYTETGALETRPFMTQTCDNELQLRKIRDQYAYEYQTMEVTDEEGNVSVVKTGNKMYKVVAHKLAYIKIADIDAEINGIFTA